MTLVGPEHAAFVFAFPVGACLRADDDMEHFLLAGLLAVAPAPPFA